MNKMMTYNEFINDGNTGGYVSLKVDQESSMHIDHVLSHYNIDNLIDDLHLTLMYDARNPSIISLPEESEYDADVIGIEMLGEEGSEWRAIVLKLGGEQLAQRHKELLTAGYKHSYPDFIPHVSIKYKPTQSDIDTIMKNKESIVNAIGYVVLENETTEMIKDIK